MMNNIFQYGEKVDGYEELVLNEREIRGASSILFLWSFLSICNINLINNYEISINFLLFLFIDFSFRVIQPKYSPSLLLSKLIVSNQAPIYVAAKQKRFAWSIGFFLIIISLISFKLTFNYNILLFISSIFMFLLFFESAFSICIGCKIYKLFNKNINNCSGGTCSFIKKEPIQKFNFIQLIILIIFLFSLIYIFLK